MNNLYILKDRKPVLVEDVEEWGKWFETADRQIALDELDGVRVWTVFLGIEHYAGCLFETMIFGGPMDQQQRRYRTYEEAEQGHKEMVAEVKQALAEEADSWPTELAL